MMLARVDMDDIKSSRRSQKRYEWGDSMSVDLGTLTLYTGLSPMTNVGVDTRPNKARGDEFLCSTNTRMGESIERVENNTSPRERNQRTFCTGGSVTVERVG